MDTNIINQNGRIVALEFARDIKGKVVKIHVPEFGDMTYDVQIDYEFDRAAKNESFRVRDLPYRCLIWSDDCGPAPVNVFKTKPSAGRALIDQMEGICKDHLPDDIWSKWDEVHSFLTAKGAPFFYNGD